MAWVEIEDLAAQYGLKRKSVRQLGRRHGASVVIQDRSDGAVVVDGDLFAAWWNEYRDHRMDAVRQGRPA
jgi:hypothetical protein